MHYYTTGPIDMSMGWQTLDDYAMRMLGDGDDAARRDKMGGLFGRVFELAAAYSKGNGDASGAQIYVGTLPDDTGSAMMFAVKNGTGATFLASPHELPWIRGGF
jgi:hypothetical protein